MKTLYSAFALALLGTVSAQAAGVAREATITQFFNDVRTIEGSASERPARANEVIREKQGVRTAAQARAELRFKDNALLRLGANTIFTFDAGANEYEVKQGTILLQAPKGGGAKIRTAAITAAIVGTTIMLEYTPDVIPPPGSNKKKKKGYVKVIVLEGTLRLFVNNRTGESVLLNAGQMLITSPDAVQLPPPVTIDISRILETSVLANNNFWGGAASLGVVYAPVNREIERQRELVGSGRLQPTNLIIPGRGTNVVLTSPSSGPGAFDPLQNRRNALGSSLGGGGSAPPVLGPVFVNRPTTLTAANTINTPLATITGGSGDIFATFYPGRSGAGGMDFAQYIFPDAVRPVDSWGPFGGFITHITDFHAPIEVFKFESLTISGTPSYVTSRPGTGPMDNVPNVALVGQTGLTISGGTFNTTGLSLIALVTENGPLTLATGATFNSPSTEVILHARGANGSLIIDGIANLGSELVSAVAEQDFRLSGTMGGGSVNISAGRDIQILPSGIFTVSSLTLSPAGSASLGGTFTGLSSLTLNAPLVTLTANQNLGTAGGRITAGAGGFSGGTFQLTAPNLDLATTGGGAATGGIFNVRDIILAGTLNAGVVTARNITGAAGTITVAGALTAQSLITLGNVSVGTLNVGSLDVGGILFSRNVTITNSVSAGTLGRLGVIGLDATAPTSPGGDGGTFNLTTTSNLAIIQDINASTGLNGAMTSFGGRGGIVNITSSGHIVINAGVFVSNSAPPRASAQAGTITVTGTRNVSPSISVGSTAVLSSLLAAAAPGPGGRVTLVATGGGSIDVSGRLQADRGTVEVRNDAGDISTASTSEFRGSIVKLGALGPNGTLLIGGGILDADNTIKLYATGANGTVRFMADTVLGGNSVKVIAGNTVTIDNSRTVTIIGPAPAQVFTNNPNYTGFGGNGSTTGTFGGQGATTSPLGGQPGF